MSGTTDPSRDLSAFSSYVKWKSVMAAKALTGHKYQIHGAAERGEAAPTGMRPPHGHFAAQATPPAPTGDAE
jgi:hypothetical protein